MSVDMYQSGGFPLHAAAQDGKLQQLLDLIASGLDIESANELQERPIHVASLNGHLDIVKALISHGCNVNAQAQNPSKDYGATPLHFAMQNSDPSIANTLITAGANVNAKTVSLFTPLHIAAMMGSSAVVRALISAQADVNSTDRFNFSPLMIAAERNFTELVEIFIKNGAVVNITGQRGETPLHFAAAHYHFQICKDLVDKGADVNAADVNGVRPIHVAASGLLEGDASCPGRKESKLNTVKLLIAHGANVHAKCNKDTVFSETALQSAIKCDDTDVTKCLLSNGACYDEPFCSVICPISTFELASCNNSKSVLPLLHITQQLFKAVENGDCAGIESCVEQGAVLNSGSVKYGTPLIYASCKGLLPVVDILIKKGADVNIPNSNNATPLHFAAKFAHFNILSTLMQHGAIYNIKTKNKTPLDFAAEAGHNLIVVNLKLVYSWFELVEKGIDKPLKDLQIMVAKIPTGFLPAVVNCKNVKGETLFDIAIKNECKNICSCLQSLKKY